MKKRVVRLVISCFAVAVVALLLPQGIFACTSFQVKANDGTVVIGRSNKFVIDAHSQIVFQPAGKEFISKTPDGKPGKTWTTRYAFLGINGLGLAESFAEGMNEVGLSVEGLFLRTVDMRQWTRKTANWQSAPMISSHRSWAISLLSMS